MKIGSTTGFTKSMVDVLLEDAKKQGYVPDASVAGDEVSTVRNKKAFQYDANRPLDKIALIMNKFEHVWGKRGRALAESGAGAPYGASPTRGQNDCITFAIPLVGGKERICPRHPCGRRLCLWCPYDWT